MSSMNSQGAKANFALGLTCLFWWLAGNHRYFAFTLWWAYLLLPVTFITKSVVNNTLLLALLPFIMLKVLSSIQSSSCESMIYVEHCYTTDWYIYKKSYKEIIQQSNWEVICNTNSCIALKHIGVYSPNPLLPLLYLPFYLNCFSIVIPHSIPSVHL